MGAEIPLALPSSFIPALTVYHELTDMRKCQSIRPCGYNIEHTFYDAIGLTGKWGTG
jgi:hypothetical protein